MRREAITLVLTMAIGSVLMAACDNAEEEVITSVLAPAQQRVFEQERGGQLWQEVPLPEDLARGPGAVQGSAPALSLA